jgi:hypothetical protein
MDNGQKEKLLQTTKAAHQTDYTRKRRRLLCAGRVRAPIAARLQRRACNGALAIFKRLSL